MELLAFNDFIEFAARNLSAIIVVSFSTAAPVVLSMLFSKNVVEIDHQRFVGRSLRQSNDTSAEDRAAVLRQQYLRHLGDGGETLKSDRWSYLGTSIFLPISTAATGLVALSLTKKVPDPLVIRLVDDAKDYVDALHAISLIAIAGVLTLFLKTCKHKFCIHATLSKGRAAVMLIGAWMTITLPGVYYILFYCSIR